LKKWEIYLARVPFKDITESKIRSVLILDNTVIVIDCLKMTSQPPRCGEYVLKDWKEAGLRKPTTVRVTKRLSLPTNNIIKKIGMLSVLDISEIQKLL